MVEPLLSFTVYGDPAPQGSKKAVGRSSTGRVLLVESSKKVKPWREVVRAAALNAWIPNLVLAVPLALSVTFTLQKPLKVPKQRNGYVTTYPDLDKLLRSTGDALTHSSKAPGIITDDSLIVMTTAAKTYPHDERFPDALDRPGAVIHLYPAGDYR